MRQGTVRPIIHENPSRSRTRPKAHGGLMETSAHIGKIVLTVG